MMDRSILSSLNYNDYSKVRKEADGLVANTLEVFAFGVLSDYTNNKEKCIELTEDEITKLRQLTLVSLAQQRREIPLVEVQKALEFELRQDMLRELLKFNNTLSSYLVDPEGEKLVVNHSGAREVFVPGQDAPLQIVQNATSIDSIVKKLERFKETSASVKVPQST